jgi:putative tryptophan/tyrosine transport system substrate-binding protein
MPYPMNKGQDKTFWITYNESRGKQVVMAIKAIVVLVVGLMLASVCLADAQQPGKFHLRAMDGNVSERIGVLVPNTAALFANNADALRQGLRELGYVEGQNLGIEYRYAEGNLNWLPVLATELVRLKVNVIVASSSAAVSAARDATKEIPIIFSTTGDPVARGLVASLARPGGNITGVTLANSELYGKRLELLKEIIPRLSLAAILFNPTDPGADMGMKEAGESGKALGIRVESLEVRNANDIDRAFESATRLKVGALTFIHHPPITTYQKQVVELAVKSRLPAIYASTEWCESGGLISYGRSFPDTHRRLAVYVDKVLKGAKPSDLPVEQWKKLELVINLKAAKQIGLTVPPEVLARADKVIK